MTKHINELNELLIDRMRRTLGCINSSSTRMSDVQNSVTIANLAKAYRYLNYAEIDKGDFNDGKD